MSKISKDGFEQIQVIKNALDSMYDKLSNVNLYVKNESKKVKNIEKLYSKHNVFNDVQAEFEAIAGIVALTQEWEEVDNAG